MNASGPLSCIHLTPRRTRHRAFSLVELGLVILIVAVMAAIAAPRYANALSHYRVDVAAQRIMADLTLVQARAKAASKSWTISFDDAADSYTYYDDTILGNAATVVTVDMTDAPYHATIGSPVFGADADLVFDGYGIADSGGTVIIASGGYRTTITLDGATCKITAGSQELTP